MFSSWRFGTAQNFPDPAVIVSISDLPRCFGRSPMISIGDRVRFIDNVERPRTYRLITEPRDDYAVWTTPSDEPLSRLPDEHQKPRLITERWNVADLLELSDSFGIFTVLRNTRTGHYGRFSPETIACLFAEVSPEQAVAVAGPDLDVARDTLDSAIEATRELRDHIDIVTTPVEIEPSDGLLILRDDVHAAYFALLDLCKRLDQQQDIAEDALDAFGAVEEIRSRVEELCLGE